MGMNLDQHQAWLLWLNRGGYWFNKAKAQPSWVTRTALILATVVFVLPLLALAIAAIVVGLGVLLLLGAILACGRLVRGILGGGGSALHSEQPGQWSATASDGRVNVRVIER